MKLLTKKQSPFTLFSFFLLMVLAALISSCGNNKPSSPQFVNTPEEMEDKTQDIIKEIIQQSAALSKLDSENILQAPVLQYLYEKNDYRAKWSEKEKWTQAADSVIDFIKTSRLYGLFPEDYHWKTIHAIQNKFQNDSLSTGDRKNATLWSKADILLTDALVQMIKDIKIGRLQKDSLTLRTDSSLSKEFYQQKLNNILLSSSIASSMDSLEPGIKAYHDLKAGIKKFLDSAKFDSYTYIPFPVYDSLKFKKLLQRRLFEEQLLPSADSLMDSLSIAAAIKKYQEKNKLKVDGKAGGETIRLLNLTDKDKFVRIAISLDKYKMLPEKMPAQYLWVNLPGYYLQLWENDSVKLYSRVVVGKPLTRTPELTSNITELITYPQWTIPQSIIVKEILPALKKNPGYLQKKGFSLLDGKNEEVDPYFVDWSLYKKGIPYRIIQGSGDANALGVMKFNFPNKYAVYLHDTNQRYLFGQASRAFSHGCVRVQEWQKLSNYLLRNDERLDSIPAWLKKKEKHFIPVKNRLPLFIRYITAEGRDGKIVFYDDIYNEDHRLRERYFAGK